MSAVTVAHAITQPEANLVRMVLRSVEHVPVGVHVDERGRVNVWPEGRPLTTIEEVTALRAFAAVTDAPLRWFPAVA